MDKIVFAINTNDHQSFLNLLKIHKNVVVLLNSHSLFTVQYYLCMMNNIKFLKLLLKKKPKTKINIGNTNKLTPFYIACYYHCITIVIYLLNNFRVNFNICKFNIQQFPIFFQTNYIINNIDNEYI